MVNKKVWNILRVKNKNDNTGQTVMTLNSF